jgi:hypothetical protein
MSAYHWAMTHRSGYSSLMAGARRDGIPMDDSEDA